MATVHQQFRRARHLVAGVLVAAALIVVAFPSLSWIFFHVTPAPTPPTPPSPSSRLEGSIYTQVQLRRRGHLVEFLHNAERMFVNVCRIFAPNAVPYSSGVSDKVRELFMNRNSTSDGREKSGSASKKSRVRQDSVLHQLEQATGRKHEKRRIGRPCVPDEDEVLNSFLPDSSKSVERSIYSKELFPATKQCDWFLGDGIVGPTSAEEAHTWSCRGRREQDEPHAGMIMQVIPVGSDDEMDNGDGSINNVNKRRACISHHDLVGDSTEGDADRDEISQYVLVDRIGAELGLPSPDHYLDYAYRPVAPQDGRKSTQRRHAETSDESLAAVRWDHNKELPLPGESKAQSRHIDRTKGEEEDEAVGFRWFSWLNYVSRARLSGWGRSGQQTKAGAMYERVGDHAFAGGSHGEVWRARRRCHRSFGVKGDDLDGSGRKGEEHEVPHNTQTHRCDEQKELIMKRLKVEHGYDLLEAGLREVYFGELLAREVEAPTLVTTYVDHFFRYGTPSIRSTQGSLELWIVYEDAGPSLRSYLYTPISSGEFVIYQHSSFWRRLRMGVARDSMLEGSSAVALMGVPPPLHSHAPSSGSKRQSNASSGSDRGRKEHHRSADPNQAISEGKVLMKEVLRQILESVAFLHSKGIIHRDVKPSNIMCMTTPGLDEENILEEIQSVSCVLGDFSSAYDDFTARNLYVKGPSAAEQTDEYAPPEVLFGPTWVPFDPRKPQSYDSWSLGVVALELLLGTPQVFTVDKRTTALLSNKMKKEGATPEDIRRALYLAALSQFCIYIPTADRKSWPLRAGDPLHGAFIVKPTCTLQDFHTALRARDPLGIGFDKSSDLLLQLIWRLLAWDPMERITASEALEHPYFHHVHLHDMSFSLSLSPLSPGMHNALERQALDPRINMNSSVPTIFEFTCPKCGKTFEDYNSCQRHARSRRHAKFCDYDRSQLPPCLNAHSMLPAHPTSGYCDIQGRRKTIEDFHTIHLDPNHQFYGIFDGHCGNLASKYAASFFYEQLMELFSDLDKDVQTGVQWKEMAKKEMNRAFDDLHNGILEALAESPVGIMDNSGTTATILFVTKHAIVVANVGDSRAIMSKGASYAKSGKISAIQLTVDHVASSAGEQKRIEELGGSVSKAGGVERVNGSLAVSRSLGDRELAHVLSREPHVVVLTTSDAKAQCRGNGGGAEADAAEMPCFIVLASDGLWDVVSNQEAVDMVEQVIRKYDPDHGISWEQGGAFQEAAQMLTQEAYVRGSTDNIGVCVVAIE